MLKNFFISIIKSLIIIVLLTFIFSTVSADFNGLIKDIFGDIYEYASTDVQKQVISNLAETCFSLEQGGDIVTFNELCGNRSLLDEMEKNCRDYRALKRRNIEIENEEQVSEICEQIESGEIEKICNQLKGKEALVPDFSSMDVLCKDYKAGKIKDKEFFSSFIGNSFANQEMELSGFGFFEKYNKAMDYLNNNKIIYFLILSFLIIILYLLFMNIALFLSALIGISFSIGTWILLPYFSILAYNNYVGIDTTPILASLFGGGNIFDLKALISISLIAFLKIYNKVIIILGIIFLIIGIIGKVYGFISRKKSTKKEVKTKKGKKIK